MLLQKKHWPEIGGETHSDLKYLLGKDAVRNCWVNSRLPVALSGIQGARGISYYVT